MNLPSKIRTHVARALRPNILPVLARELRAESRHAVTYWMRLFAAVCILAIIVPNLGVFDSVGGGQLLAIMNVGLFTCIWIAVPVVVADCVSRERREGTLGLLFLTPLTPGSIIVAKSFVHALRAFSLILATLPILAIVFLVGGVSSDELLRSLLLNAAALLCSLAAGILASSYGRHWIRVVLVSSLLGGLFCTLYCGLYMGRVVSAVLPLVATAGPVFSHGASMTFGNYLSVATGELLAYGPLGGAARPAFMQAAVSLFVASLFLLLLALLLAARHLRASWQSEALSARQTWWLRTFCSPRFWAKAFKNKMSRQLDLNPVGWLQQYSWSSRLARWGWCGGAILFLTYDITNFGYYQAVSGLVFAALVMLLGVAFSASNSFGKERQSGAMELILVTPLTEWQIVWGRLRGIWGQFLPAIVVWMLVWFFLGALLDSSNGGPSRLLLLWLFPTTFLAASTVGLGLSIRRLHFFAAFLLACAYSVLVPLLFASVFFLDELFSRRMEESAVVGLAFTVGIFQILAASHAVRRLHENLTRRNFAFH